MLSEESSITLSRLLMKLIQGEQQVEISRKCLSDLYDFSPESFFFNLCSIYPNEILPRDLKDFLVSNSANIEDEHLNLLVRQYSSGQNGRLDLEDFCKLVLPSTNEILNIVARGRFGCVRESSRAKYYFLALLKAEGKLQAELEEVKKELFGQEGFSLWKAFGTLNKSGKGRVDEGEIKEFMRKYGNYVSSDDFDALMRRVDVEEDLEISYNEFLEALMPLHVPYKKEEQEENAENCEEKEENCEENKENYEENEEKPEENQVFLTASDDKMVADELNSSPRFQNDPESNNHSFETPEKSKGNKPRSLPSKKPTELSHFLGELLTLELDHERKLEFCRQNLIIKENFSVLNTFSLIDKEDKGEISIIDFEKFIDGLGIETSREIIWIIFRRFGDDDSLTLSFNNFIKIFQCYDEEYSALLKMESGEDFDEDTCEVLKDFFEVLLKYQENIESYKENYADLIENNLDGLFEFLDNDKDGEVSMGDLRAELKKYGVLCSDTDLFSVVCRYSKDSAESFTFEEFRAKVLKT